jgi:dTDP-4-amino-4,6-dideoxygalactose transaminase
MTITLFNPVYETRLFGDFSNALKRVAQNGIYVNGAECQRFEEEVQAHFQSPFAIAVASGTMALELLLRADSVGPDDQVVTSAHTFVAVVEAILHVGAQPLLVDIDPLTWQMPPGDWPDDVVIACHLYGGASAAFQSAARLLYEDASQSLGGAFEGAYLGTLTRAAAVSLYPTKNLSAMGDAGVILTRDTALASRLRALRNHGQAVAQVHDYCGATGRMDEIQAAILSEKLKRFGDFIEARRRAAQFYNERFEDLPVQLPQPLPGSQGAPNLFVIRCQARDELKAFLQAGGIGAGIHYPTAIHRMPAYRDCSWAQVSLPHTERLCAEILSLPLWVGISPAQQARVVDAVRAFFGADGRRG